MTLGWNLVMLQFGEEGWVLRGQKCKKMFIFFIKSIDNLKLLNVSKISFLNQLRGEKWGVNHEKRTTPPITIPKLIWRVETWYVHLRWTFNVSSDNIDFSASSNPFAALKMWFFGWFSFFSSKTKMIYQVRYRQKSLQFVQLASFGGGLDK